MAEDDQPGRERDPELDKRVMARRDQGASWHEIEAEFGLTRQQARYCYQRGIRVVRRKSRRDL